MVRYVAAAYVVALLAGCADPAAVHWQQQVAADNARQAEAAAQQEAQLRVIDRTPLPANFKAQIDNFFAGTLRDPSSRRLAFLANPKGSIVCGTVNSRNGFGGYAGPHPFAAWFHPSGRLGDVETLSWDEVHWIFSGPTSGKMTLERALFSQCKFIQ